MIHLLALSFSANRFRFASAALLCSFTLAAPNPLQAAAPDDAKSAKPDVIVFTNGDQLTGKFLRSVGGNAIFHSDIAGDVTVSWDKVKEIHSSSKFVVLEKGFHHGHNALPAHLPEGSLALENKQIELTPNDGIHTEPIPLTNVAYVIDQPTFDKALRHEPGFFDEWTGNATAGATVVQATQNTYNFTGGVSLVRLVPPVAWLDPRNRTTVDFTATYGKITQPDTPSVKTAIYHADAERDGYFSTQFYMLGQVAFDHNYSQSLDLQQIYGGGLGWTIMKQPKQTLDLKGTLQYEKQSFLNEEAGVSNTTPSPDQNLVGSTFAVNYTGKLPKGMVYTQQLEYIPAWNITKDYSVGETDKLIMPLYKRLNLSLGTIDTYLNDPAVAVPTIKRNSFQFNLGATFTLLTPH